MSKNVSDFLVERLSDWGVKRIFGYPGDGINGIMGALNRAKDKLDFIQVRHEEMAAFMACAHAKFTGEVGVCLATSGPGAIHLLNGLYDAKLDHQPVVAIVGQQNRMALGGNYQQEVDLISLFKDVAHEYVQMASTPAQMRHLVDRAMRIAQAERTVCCVIIPNDIQEMDAQTPPREHGTIHSGIGYQAPRTVPHAEELQRAADVLNTGNKVAMLVGAGALNATDEILEVAELLGAGIAKALLGKAAVPDEKILNIPLVSLLGQVRPAVPIYGSGGFTSYSVAALQKQLADWTDKGITRVKMKIGREPEKDVARVNSVRQVIGPTNELFVDANGAYSCKQALAMAQSFAETGVSWFEEPVSSNDLEGLRLIRDRAPPGIDISAGEYGYDSLYFRRMLQAGAVDVLQADATRCAGITGFMQAATLCQAFNVPLSSHCAPSIHLHPCCAATPVRHLEYFYDHVRIEKMLFDGVIEPVKGKLTPDFSRPGLGLEFKHADASRYAV